MIHQKEGSHIFQRRLAINKESKRGKYEGDKTQQDDIIKTKEGSHIIKTAGEKYKDETGHTTQEGDFAIDLIKTIKRKEKIIKMTQHKRKMI